MPAAESAALAWGIHDPGRGRPSVAAGSHLTPQTTLGGVRHSRRTSGGSLAPKTRFVPPPVPRWGKRGVKGERVSSAQAKAAQRPPWSAIAMLVFMRSHVNRSYPACEKWPRFGQNRGFRPVFDWCRHSVLWYNSRYRRTVRRAKKMARRG